jgi:hypothetical protein
MLIQYLKGKETSSDNIDKILLIFLGILSSFTIFDFDPKILKLLATPLGQFIIMFSFLYILFRKDKSTNISEILAESIIYVIILRILKKVVHHIL